MNQSLSQTKPDSVEPTLSVGLCCCSRMRISIQMLVMALTECYAAPKHRTMANSNNKNRKYVFNIHCTPSFSHTF